MPTFFYQIKSSFDWLCLAAVAITFVVAMNYTTHHIGGYGLSMSFNNATWMAFAVLMFISIVRMVTLCEIRISGVFIAYLCCLGLLLLPILYNPFPLGQQGKMTILATLAAISLLLVMSQIQQKQFKDRILFILFISALIQTIWGGIQYYFIFENSLLFMRADVGVPYGTFSQKNVFASYRAMGSLLCLYFFFKSKHKSILLVGFTFTLIAFNSHLSMLVEAKTGRIVPILAVGVYIAYSAHKYGKKRICSAILIICIVFSFMPKQWFDIRSEQVVTSPIAINSLGLRPIMYQLGFEMVMDKPLTGYGFGNLAYEFKQRKLAYERLHDIDLINLQITEHIHNEPLQWMMQLGVVPGIAFLLIFIVWCVGLFKGWLDPGILLLALPFVGHSLLEYPFYHSAPHLFAFVIILGLAIRKTDKTIRFSPVLSGIFVPLAGFVAYKIIAFMMMSLAASSALVEYRLGGESDISLLYSVEPTSTFAPFFIHEKHEWIFKQALQTGKISQKETFDFIDFLEAYRKEAPQAVLYVQLAELYIIAGQKQKAQAIMSQAKSFFPNDEKVIAYFEGR